MFTDKSSWLKNDSGSNPANTEQIVEMGMVLLGGEGGGGVQSNQDGLLVLVVLVVLGWGGVGVPWRGNHGFPVRR